MNDIKRDVTFYNVNKKQIYTVNLITFFLLLVSYWFQHFLAFDSIQCSSHRDGLKPINVKKAHFSMTDPTRNFSLEPSVNSTS